jgi:dienelactone hydrolase
MTIRRYWLIALAAVTMLQISCAPPAAVPGGGSAVPVTIESLSGDGVYEVATYTDFPDVPQFAAGTIYYPRDADRQVGGVAVAPGFTERQQHIEWWGPRLASHGFAVLILDTNDVGDRPELRAEALIAAIRLLRDENDRQGSPLRGRIDPTKMAVMGHSMGGGGALIAANEYPDEIQASIPFTSWQPGGVFDRTTAPTLVIAAEDDRIAPVAEHAWPHYQSIPSTTPKVYLEVGGGGHFIADTTRGEDLATIGRYGIAWLKLYLDGDQRYRPLLYGAEQARDADKFSRYVMSR